MTIPGLPAVVLAGSLVAAAVAAVVLAREMRAARPRYGSLTLFLGNVVLFGPFFVLVKGEVGPARGDSLLLLPVLAIGAGIVLAGDECDSRARHVQVFDRIAEVIDGVVVGHHQLRGRYGAHPAEVTLTAMGMGVTSPPSSLEVALMIAPGGADWLATFGRLPGARKTKGWYVASRDRVLAEQLTQLGVLTLLQHRYYSVGQRWETELWAPEVRYSAESGRLRYFVRVAGGRLTTTFTSEHFRAQLDLLTRLGTLDARANAGPPREPGS